MMMMMSRMIPPPMYMTASLSAIAPDSGLHADSPRVRLTLPLVLSFPASRMENVGPLIMGVGVPAHGQTVDWRRAGPAGCVARTACGVARSRAREQARTMDRS